MKQATTLILLLICMIGNSQSRVGYSKSDIIKELESYSVNYTDTISNKNQNYIAYSEDGYYIAHYFEYNNCILTVLQPESIMMSSKYKLWLDSAYESVSEDTWIIYRDNLQVTLSKGERGDIYLFNKN